MKAFLSYSLVDRELYIITLLSNDLRNGGYDLASSIGLDNNRLDFTTTQQIASSQLFVGIISVNGMQRSRVLQEWQYATRNRIPAVLLIEENVPIASGADPNSYITFSRNNPQLAIHKIKKRMSSKQKDEQETAGWVLAGAALLALLAIFSNGKR